MADKYQNIKVSISEGQKEKIRKAIKDSKPVSIQLKFSDLMGDDVLALTKGQVDAIARAYKAQMGIRINMSKTQTEYNKNLTGGFLGALLSAALPAVIGAVAPDAISWLYKKFTGTGAIIKNDGQVIKMKKLGDGLFLRPAQSNRFANYGNGLYIRPAQGGEYELANDVKLDDLSLYNLFSKLT